ncbi:MAG: family 20 glycosylhydrolase [Planctomycetota bacterium]
MNSLCWFRRDTPAELRGMLEALGEMYPIRERETGNRRLETGNWTLETGNRKPKNGIRLEFERTAVSGLAEVRRPGDRALVRYDTPARAGRAIGALLAGLVPADGTYRERTPFATLGVMLDCSRNAVVTVDHFKIWLRRMVLLGCNSVMLYTEDTYRLPGEPWFGWQRGAYTAGEIRAIDDYAAALGIEVIPCIQTLGHLEQILRHGAYRAVRDTARVLLVDEPKTHRLIQKMVRHWSSVVRSRRIHIGMDEAHDLGRGRYQDLHGSRDAFDLFSRHLARVVGMCRREGLRPMIWSDMFFRMGSKTQDYYDRAAKIPGWVIRRIPRDVELVYWDYYHENEGFYRDWIARHRRMGKEPVMASGVWTWNKYWYDRRITEKTAGPCLAACRRDGVKELVFTMWGDNGAYCDHDSAFAGMAWCADRAYGASPRGLSRRFAAVCGGNYAAHARAADLHGGLPGLQPDLWDDPFFETRFRTWAKDRPGSMARAARFYAALAGRLAPHGNDRTCGDLRHAELLARVFAVRYALSAEILAAYRRRDRRALAAVRRRIPGVLRAVRRVADSHRALWMRCHKPEGFETVQARYGMLEARYREMATRLAEYRTGKIHHLAELDEFCPADLPPGRRKR